MGGYWEQAFWNAYARSYDNLAKHFQPYRDLVKEVCDHVDELADGRSLTVLDAGCGTGNYSIELANRGHQVIGIDLSDAMLARARTKGADASCLVFTKHDLTKPLPFPDDEFDAAITTMVLYSLPEPAHLVSELRRVVKDDGGFVAVTMRTKVRVFGALGESYRSEGLGRAFRTFSALFGVGIFNLVINTRHDAQAYNLMDTIDFSTLLTEQGWRVVHTGVTYTGGVGSLAVCRSD